MRPILEQGLGLGELLEDFVTGNCLVNLFGLGQVFLPDEVMVPVVIDYLAAIQLQELHLDGGSIRVVLLDIFGDFAAVLNPDVQDRYGLRKGEIRIDKGKEGSFGAMYVGSQAGKEIDQGHRD